MTAIQAHIAAIRATLPKEVTLVCVSKFHPATLLQEAYDFGERDFGESRVQELCQKQEVLPKDIRWHFIGHLQTNKVRTIIPFIYLIESVDSERLLETINKEAARIGRQVKVLLEVHTANETTKSGFLPNELACIDFERYEHVEICGLMTMATNTEDEKEIHRCFHMLTQLADSDKRFKIRSFGMSDDYLLAIGDGSTMVRIGTTIFGERVYL